MEEKLNGLVIAKTDYGENDRIVKIFTLEKGTARRVLLRKLLNKHIS